MMGRLAAWGWGEGAVVIGDPCLEWVVTEVITEAEHNCRDEEVSAVMKEHFIKERG